MLLIEVDNYDNHNMNVIFYGSNAYKIISIHTEHTVQWEIFFKLFIVI